MDFNLPKASINLAHLSTMLKANADNLATHATTTAAKTRTHFCAVDHERELTMKNRLIKIAFVSGLVIGFVAGARAGRAHYEKIKASAIAVNEHPKTQEVKEKLVEKTVELKDLAEDKIKDAAAESKAKATVTSENTAP